jgi:diguanylate cyclase (GGDEF)-like protein
LTSAGADEADRRLNQTVGLVVVVALGFLGWAIYQIVNTGSYSDTTLMRVAIVAPVIGLANRAMINIRVKSSRHALASTDAATLIGLTLLPGPWLVVGTALAVGIAKGTAKLAPIKVAFNTGKDTVAAGCAVLVASAFGVHGPFAATLDDLPALVAAALTLQVADEVMAMPVLALATRTPILQRFRTHADIRILATLGRLALAIVAIFLLARDPKLVIVVPLLIIGLHFASANRLRERAERDAWQKLAQATDEFNEVDLDSVITSAVSRAADLFSADAVELELRLATGAPRLTRGDARAIRYDGPPEGAPADTEQAISIPLESHEGSSDIGELRLRFRSKIMLSEREDYTLRTFAAALCTAIRNAAAFAEAQRLADNHAYAAAHDPLTSLANRRHLFEMGADLLATRPQGGLIGLLLIDLNHFKEINDTLGHSAGDQVLIEVASRLAVAAQPGDLVARLGGDEFAIVLLGIPVPALAIPRARTVLAALDQPFEIDGMRMVVEASAGVALAPSRGGVHELLRRADVAMYQAKREGQTVAMYARARDTADLGRLALSAELPRAVAEHEFAVNFQPVVDLASGEVISMEALARWHHPDHGEINPTRFLDSVERSGLLAAFSEAVLDQALRAAATWRADGFPLPVAVNVSPRSLLDPDFPDVIEHRLELADVPPAGLIIELTESLTLSQLDVVDDVLHTLRDLGIRLALDDFGTGYSSLATLARVPVHELKIDRAFVAAMDGSAQAAVVRSTIDLGRSLGMLVVAEGVESEEQRNRLWELGCPAGQGHLFARPMPIHRLLAALRRGYGGQPATLAPPLHASGEVIRLPARRPQAKRRDELG